MTDCLAEAIVRTFSHPPRLLQFRRGVATAVLRCRDHALRRRYLETSIARTLTRLYKGDPTNADEWLADEIYRAACDPGAIGVFRRADTHHPVSRMTSSHLRALPG